MAAALYFGFLPFFFFLVDEARELPPTDGVIAAAGALAEAAQPSAAAGGTSFGGTLGAPAGAPARADGGFPRIDGGLLPRALVPPLALVCLELGGTPLPVSTLIYHSFEGIESRTARAPAPPLRPAPGRLLAVVAGGAVAGAGATTFSPRTWSL